MSDNENMRVMGVGGGIEPLELNVMVNVKGMIVSFGCGVTAIFVEKDISYWPFSMMMILVPEPYVTAVPISVIIVVVKTQLPEVVNACILGASICIYETTEPG
ncbi:MAG: hypothetical protein LBB86_09805, partial [Oscillospiraceae bacterium]|nr:hypothetical protein [Oscillospiraceae bacterium]